MKAQGSRSAGHAGTIAKTETVSSCHCPSQTATRDLPRSIVVKRRSLVLFVFVALIMSASVSLRGECVGFPLKHYIRYADQVFQGTVTELEPAGRSKAIVHLDVTR